MRIAIKIFAACLISIFLLCFLFKDVDLKVFARFYEKIDLMFILFVIGIYLFHCLLRAMRFSFVTRTNLKTIYMISCIHGFMNRLLPFRSGEFTWPVLINKYTNVDYLTGISMLILIRYLDLACIILLFLLSSLVFFPDFMNRQLIILISGISIFQIVTILLLNRFFVPAIRGVRWSAMLVNSAKLEKLSNKLIKINDYLCNKGYWRVIGVLCVYTLLDWVSIYAIYYLYILMFNIHYSFLTVIWASSFVAIVTNLPINTFGRLGTFELGWAAGFMLIGLSEDIAIPMGLFVNITNTCIACFIALFGYIYLTKTKKRQKVITYREP